VCRGFVIKKKLKKAPPDWLKAGSILTITLPKAPIRKCTSDGHLMIEAKPAMTSLPKYQIVKRSNSR